MQVVRWHVVCCSEMCCCVVWCVGFGAGYDEQGRKERGRAGQGGAHFHSVASCVAKSTDCDIFTQLLRLS